MSHVNSTPRRGRALAGVLLLVTLAVPSPGQRAAQGVPPRPNAIPKHLRLKGDPAEKTSYAEGWIPPAPVWKDGKITEAPIWCDALAKEGLYVEGAQVPQQTRRFLGRPERDIRSWMEGDAKLKPVVLATEHARLVVALPKVHAGLKRVPKHQRLWLEDWFPGKLKLSKPLLPKHRGVLFALRYLQMEARFLDMLCLTKGAKDFIKPFPKGHLGSRGRGEFFVLPEVETYREFGRHFFGAFGHKTSWWYNKRADNMITSVHSDGLKDAQVAARFDYAVAQHLVFHYRGFYHKLPPWLVAGIAHHFERLHKKPADTFAAMGTPENWGKKFSKRNWRRIVRSRVSSAKEIPLAKLGLMKDLHELKPENHPQAWSLVNYLLGLGRERFRRFIDEMKTKPPDETLIEVQYRAIERAYEIDMLTLHHAWRDWVLKTYR